MRTDVLRKLDDLRTEVEHLEGGIKKLQREKRDVDQEVGLSEEVVRLKKRIGELQIGESKLTEGHEREKREVEHMVGLERRRQEFEIEQAKRETKVELREAALEEQRKRFEEQMKFIENRLAQEVKYLKDDIVKALLERLPSFTFEHKESVGGRLRKAE
jgi:hypothetical protein